MAVEVVVVVVEVVWSARALLQAVVPQRPPSLRC